ncbi:transport protein Avl9-domain-containing protein [Mycena maculata]|uniref:Transport protein Avl9-domain-containing protein n=1 Tax=Mycena maculata TaxID=230809 RepID=A0AAD7NYM7_9AGAR|nr:transport protein Avl9-domain-containing protein [Mycena maculata]
MSLETELHPPPDIHNFLSPGEDDDGDTASQRSISLSSPAVSPRNSVQDPSQRSGIFSNRASNPYTLDTDLSSEPDDSSMYTREMGASDSPNTSVAPSVVEELEVKDHAMPTYPPSPPRDDTASIASVASGSSRKARPESMLVLPGDRPLVLGIALVDFNHLVGPRIEYSSGDIFDDEEVAKILPFLALPDGAHLSAEDYSYFHLVPSGPNPTTIFGISCNQQIAASALLVKMPDVTRSTVQKAVVVLASKPIFGPIRDKLGVVTTALFNQRDFRETDILDDFSRSLELSVRSQLTESGLYMGTNLRELVHTFRQRTLVLVKALILQKRIMFYGHPVERLCTYQYSLVSLLPGLLQTLDDCGSPPLAARAPTLSRPTSLRTSDRKSMMAYTGLPLDIFGKDAFFQPYLPLQQLDIAADTKSWLCGSTNSIMTQRKEIDLLVNTETGALDFRDPKLERSAGLTAADRKWMDDIVKDVNDGWNDEEGRPVSMMYKGSDDYLRKKFEEYISAALASVRYRDFMAKGEGNGVIISGGAGDVNSSEDFNPLWISEFKHTNAYEVWERTTDPLLFDIVEPRHPCNEKPSVVADIGLRLQEGLQDLKLEQQLAPARDAVARTITAGSMGFFKAVEGVRGRWNAPRESVTPPNGDAAKRASTPAPVEVTKPDADEAPAPPTAKPLLLARHSTIDSNPTPTPPRPSVASWGAGIGSFLSNRASNPHATPSFLGMMSPSGVSSPSVFPPTPLETAPPTAVPPPSPLRTLSLLTPTANRLPAPPPQSQSAPAAVVEEPVPIVKNTDTLHLPIHTAPPVVTPEPEAPEPEFLVAHDAASEPEFLVAHDDAEEPEYLITHTEEPAADSDAESSFSAMAL